MMKNLAAVAAFAAGANALVPRGGSCCFGLSASGSASGTIGQLDDGQNRIGGGLSPAQFCIDSSSGSITDSHGRGCILTGPTTQWQCDQGAKPTPGFSIGSGGTLLYNGSPHFVACETGENGGLNLYTTSSDAQTGCRDVTLEADSCKSGGSSSASSVPQSSASPSPLPSPAPESGASSSPQPSPAPESSPTPGSYSQPSPAPESSAPESPQPSAPGSGPTSAAQPSPAPQSSPAPGSGVPPASAPQPAPSQATSAPTAPQPSTSQPASSGCAMDLAAKNYEYPHLIIPVDSSSPSKAEGTSYNGTVTSTISSVFNFDIPSKNSGKQCSLVFLFPKKEDLETSSFSFSGDGKVDFASLQSPATQSTSYSNVPAVKDDLGIFTVSPGNSYTIATFACPAGEAVGYKVSNAGSTDLNYFQDYNPSPVGLYITVC